MNRLPYPGPERRRTPILGRTAQEANTDYHIELQAESNRDLSVLQDIVAQAEGLVATVKREIERKKRIYIFHRTSSQYITGALPDRRKPVARNFARREKEKVAA